MGVTTTLESALLPLVLPATPAVLVPAAVAEVPDFDDFLAFLLLDLTVLDCFMTFAVPGVKLPVQHHLPLASAQA